MKDIEQILREAARVELPDDGFSARMMQALPAKAPLARAWVELRTLDESALPGFVVTTWQGVFAPGGTPQPVLTKVHAALVQAIRSPELKPRIEQQDMDPSGPSLKDFTAAYYAELKRWTKVAKDAGLKAD